MGLVCGRPSQTDLAKALAENQGVSAGEQTIRQFLDRLDEKVKEIRTKLHERMEADDIRSEAITWLLEGGLNGYRASKGGVWGYAFPALINRLAPASGLVKAPMVRRRDRDSTKTAKRAVNLPFVDVEEDSGDCRYEPMRTLLQMEMERHCEATLAILAGGCPQAFGDPETRRARIHEELGVFFPDAPEEAIRRTVDRLLKVRGPRGGHNGKQ